ncbi:hypothetical protein Tco_1099319 [Tanacetum coccineum]
MPVRPHRYFSLDIDKGLMYCGVVVSDGLGLRRRDFVVVVVVRVVVVMMIDFDKSACSIMIGILVGFKGVDVEIFMAEGGEAVDCGGGGGSISGCCGMDQAKRKGKAVASSKSSATSFDVEVLAKLMANEYVTVIDPCNAKKGQEIIELL